MGPCGELYRVGRGGMDGPNLGRGVAGGGQGPGDAPVWVCCSDTAHCPGVSRGLSEAGGGSCSRVMRCLSGVLEVFRGWSQAGQSTAPAATFLGTAVPLLLPAPRCPPCDGLRRLRPQRHPLFPAVSSVRAPPEWLVALPGGPFSPRGPACHWVVLVPPGTGRGGDPAIVPLSFVWLVMATNAPVFLRTQAVLRGEVVKSHLLRLCFTPGFFFIFDIISC